MERSKTPKITSIIDTDIRETLNDYLETMDRNSSREEVEEAEEDLLSAFHPRYLAYLPEERANFLRGQVEAASLVSLRNAVKRYHLAYFKEAPNRVLQAKDGDVEEAIGLARRLEIPGIIMVRTILSATPRRKMEKFLYRYLNDKTLTPDEAEDLAEEFGLK